MVMKSREKVKDLWKRCFNASDEYAEMYFRHRYQDELNVTIELNDKTVSTLQMIPYPMTFWGMTIPIAYVSGACTHPDYREQGLMGALLTEVHQRMYREGIFFSMVMPVNSRLYAYYAKRGYAATFYCSRLRVKTSSLFVSQLYTVMDEARNTQLYKEHFRYFSRKMQECSCYVQHTWGDFKTILEDLCLSGGKLMVARRLGLIHGMAFCVVKDGLVTVKEILSDNVVVNDSLLRGAASSFDADELECLLPPLEKTEESGMIRIIHAEEVLSMFARKYPTMEMLFRLVDEDVPNNNACFYVADGVCKCEDFEDQEIPTYTIKDLARLLFKRESPYMSLMLD